MNETGSLLLAPHALFIGRMSRWINAFSQGHRQYLKVIKSLLIREDAVRTVPWEIKFHRILLPSLEIQVSSTCDPQTHVILLFSPPKLLHRRHE